MLDVTERQVAMETVVGAALGDTAFRNQRQRSAFPGPEEKNCVFQK